MREIKLTQGKVAFVDDEDYERVNQFKWCANKIGNTFYAARAIRINGKKTIQKMHMFILGDTPGKPQIDHKDGNGLNNWKLNLRPCTNQENAMNQRKPNKNCSSEYLGVYLHKSTGKWLARIQIDGKRKHIGYFGNEIDAARAYDAAKKKHSPEFAKLNFPEISYEEKLGI